MSGVTTSALNPGFLSVFHVQLQYLMGALEDARLKSGEFSVREVLEKYSLGAALGN